MLSLGGGEYSRSFPPLPRRRRRPFDVCSDVVVVVEDDDAPWEWNNDDDDVGFGHSNSNLS